MNSRSIGAQNITISGVDRVPKFRRSDLRGARTVKNIHNADTHRRVRLLSAQHSHYLSEGGQNVLARVRPRLRRDAVSVNMRVMNVLSTLHQVTETGGDNAPGMLTHACTAAMAWKKV